LLLVRIPQEKRGGSEQYEHINEGRCCVD